MGTMRWTVTGVVAVLVLGACGSNPVTDSDADIGFTPCAEIECSGTLPSGAEFEIVLPQDWGGSLALFSHGMRTGAEGATEPDLSSEPADEAEPTDTVSPSETVRPSETVEPSNTASATATVSPAASVGGPEPAPLWSGSEKSIADAVLQAGYAIAGASPSETGWAVGAQIIAAEELYDYFADKVAQPKRVYAWGDSTGGLASVRLAELHPDWVSGAAAMCAPMAGPRPTFDLALDVAYAVKQLLLPKMLLVDYPSAEVAQATYDQVVNRLTGMVESGNPDEAAQLTFIAGIGHLPDRNRAESGNSAESRLKAYAAGITKQIHHSTIERFALEQTVGGNPSGNEGTDYGLRLTPALVAQINKIAPGKLDAMFAALTAGERVIPKSEAEEGAAAQGELVGNLEVPLLTLHNAFDPTFIAQSESWYRVRTEQEGQDFTANFVDLFVIPPVSYGGNNPAPEGAGNCVFTPRTVLGVMILLNDWVRRGQYPGQDTVGEAFAHRQVTITYDPGPWPEMALSPLAPPIDVAPAIQSS
jgi:pimeloyl-ACP methyl ester carboxylesterase